MYTPWLGNTAVWVLGAIWQIPLFVCLGERYSNIMCILRWTHVWFYWYWKTLLLVWDWWIGWNKWIRVCVCVCVCVCVWVGGWVSGWVCVCLYSTTCWFLQAAQHLWHTREVLDHRSFVVSISRGFWQVSSSLFLNLSYFTSKDENSSRLFTGEKTIWYNV